MQYEIQVSFVVHDSDAERALEQVREAIGAGIDALGGTESGALGNERLARILDTAEYEEPIKLD